MSEMLKDPEKILRRAIKIHGANAQVDMAIEEMSELITELMHYKRNRPHSVVSELADVMIMCEQLMLIFDCQDDLELKISDKLDRLSGRLGYE